jgi:hypothetical protein
MADGLDFSGFAKPPQPMSIGEMLNVGQGMVNLQRSQLGLQAAQGMSRFASDPKNLDEFGLPKWAEYGPWRAKNNVPTTPEIEQQIPAMINATVDTKTGLMQTVAGIVAPLWGSKDATAWDNAARLMAKLKLPGPVKAQFDEIAHIRDPDQRLRATIQFAQTYGAALPTVAAPSGAGTTATQPALGALEAQAGIRPPSGPGAPAAAPGRGVSEKLPESADEYMANEARRPPPHPGPGFVNPDAKLRQPYDDAGDQSYRYDKGVNSLLTGLQILNKQPDRFTGIGTTDRAQIMSLFGTLADTLGIKLPEGALDPSKFEETRKYFMDYINRQAAGGTDQMGRMFEVANPNMDLQKLSNMSIGKMLVAVSRVDVAARRIYDQLSQSNPVGYPAEKFPQWRANWIKDHDVRGFGLDMMGYDERQAFLTKLNRDSPKQARKVLNSYHAMNAAGLSSAADFDWEPPQVTVPRPR